MSIFNYKTRGNSSPQGKPRVYFCCHTKDFDQYFASVSDEILTKHNCAIWYTEGDQIYNEDFFADLKQMQLFVMPVTTELLCTQNPALDIEFQFAMKQHIPVLPLMQEEGLHELFNKRCGDLQLLDKHDLDPTAINYDEKLQNYLNDVLIGDALADQIRAAFDAYVFLSYRKKDRRYAQELMRLVHKNEFCRDIAIWYDEFLTPGENFNSSIQSALEKSELFLLAVTPNLVNETNYVMTTEYPMAKQSGKFILPAELVPTDRTLLSEKYKDIPIVTDAHDSAALSNALLESIRELAIRENDANPEHNYFIGLAYLSGIDVEVDLERALSLITNAAEAGLPEAMKKLADLYLKGSSVEKNPETAILWQNRLVQQQLDCYRASHGKAEALELLSSLSTLGEIFEDLRNYAEAFQTYQQSESLCSEILQSNSNDAAVVREHSFALLKLGHVSNLLGNPIKAADFWQKSCDIIKALANQTMESQDYIQLARCQANLGQYWEKHFDYYDSRTAYNDALKTLQNASDATSAFYRRMAGWIHQKLGDVNKLIKQYMASIGHYREALNYSEQLSAEYKTVTNQLNVSIIQNKLGQILLEVGDDCGATDAFLASYEIVIGLYEKDPTLDTQRQMMITSSHLAGINVQRENFELAEELYQEALQISKTLADTLGTVESYRDLNVSCEHLASLYEEMGTLEKALKLRFFELDAGKKAADLTNAHTDLFTLSTCYNDLANLLRQLKRDEEALSQYMNAYNIRKVLTAQFHNPPFLYYLHYNCSCIAETHRDLGNYEEAHAYYSESIKLCEKMVSMEETEDNLDTLGTAYVDLASIVNEQEQLTLFTKAVAVYEKLCAESPQEQRFQTNLEALQNACGDLARKLSKQGGLFQKIFGKK